jgi:hypothetical protein
MTNKKFWLVMLVAVLVFGMTVAGCDIPEEEEDDGSIDLDNYYPIVGETITATYVPYKPENTPVGTLKWQWFRGKKSIGSNSDTYTVVSADVGQKITVKVSHNGKKVYNDTGTKGVLNTPATATVSISMVASRSDSGFCSVKVTITLSDGRWGHDVDMFETFNSLVTIEGEPEIKKWGGFGVYKSLIGPSYTVSYQKSLDNVPSINLTASIDSDKVASIKSSTNVYNSLTVGTPLSTSVSQWGK